MRNSVNFLLILFSTVILCACEDIMGEDYMSDTQALGRGMNQHQKAARQLSSYSWGGPGKVTINVKPEGAATANLIDLENLELCFSVNEKYWPKDFRARGGGSIFPNCNAIWHWTSQNKITQITIREKHIQIQWDRFTSSYYVWWIRNFKLIPEDHPTSICFPIRDGEYVVTLERNRSKPPFAI